MPENVSDHLRELKKQLDLLPEATEPPPTTLQVLGRSDLEQDWQRLLFHFLSPGEAHGLDHAFLEQFLTALDERDDLAYTFSRFDLDDVQIETEVITSNERRPDAVVWAAEEWFICWELKVRASEGADQTRDYVTADSFQSIGLDKADVPSDAQHYIYLAPADAPLPAADEFVPITWEWVASEVQSFLAASHGEYPARTTAQLDDFSSTIQHTLTMTEHQENQQDKAQLYFEYYDEIKDVEHAFEDQWNEFTGKWGVQLAQALDTAEIVEISDLSDTHVAVELETQTGEPIRWIFRQGHSWAGIAVEQWRRHTDDHAVIYGSADNDKYAHITLFHRLEKNREKAVRDGVLELTLWHGNSSDEQFYKLVNERVSSKIDEREYELPPTISLTSRSGSILTATYDIPVAKHDNFFDAYIAALRDALVELTVENYELTSIITEAFEESLTEYY